MNQGLLAALNATRVGELTNAIKTLEAQVFGEATDLYALNKSFGIKNDSVRAHLADVAKYCGKFNPVIQTNDLRYRGVRGILQAEGLLP